MKETQIFLLCLLTLSPIWSGFGTLVNADEGIGKFRSPHLNNDIINQSECQKKVKIQNICKLPLYFIQNNGQMDQKVKFYGKTSRHSTFFTKRGIYLSLASNQHSISHGKEIKRKNLLTVNQIPELWNTGKGTWQAATIRNPQPEMIKLTYLGTNKNPEIIAEDQLEGKINYLLGSNPETWKTNIPTYRTVVYREVYKNIDMRFYGNSRQIEYDIVVKPGANPSCVQLAYEGIRGLQLAKEGDLEIILEEGKCIQKKPYIYQEIEGKKIEVEGRFEIKESKIKSKNIKSKVKNLQFIYGFRVASYDKRYPLVIDPILVYSTYLGGSGEDVGNGITIDTSGNVYVTGVTGSNNFPADTTLFGSNAGDTDAFVTKLSASGSLIYSTYLGGSSTDGGEGIAVDTSENVYITGFTISPDFPAPIASAPFRSHAGDFDAFVTKLDPSGSSLIYSTYLGGNGYDRGYGIAVDVSGNAYISGFTESIDFPTTASALSESNAGNADAFVTKLNASGSNLIYSTYLGGNRHDFGNGIAIDTSGNAYITGSTGSSDFPTVSALFGNNAGDTDAFITKLSASGNSLVYSTYLGGNGGDSGNEIVVDTSGDAYITGETQSNNFPTTASALFKNLAEGGVVDAFITKFNASGGSLIYSTYLGGNGEDFGNAIAVDISGNTYITGKTTSTDFPILYAIFEDNAGGAGSLDAFVTKLDAQGSSLVYSTYIGGSGDSDRGEGIAVDNSGSAYITGVTQSDDFPMVSALFESYSGGFDAFIAKIAAGETTATPTPTPTLTPSPTETPTGIALLFFKARAHAHGSVILIWKTARETDTLGFNLYRARRKNGAYKKTNRSLINAKGGDMSGARYRFKDKPSGRGTYYYKLEDVNSHGISTMHGPVKVRIF